MTGPTERPSISASDAPRLLLVGDGRASRPLEDHLAHHGFEIERVSSAVRAASAVAGHRPDVVLIDASVEGGWEGVLGAIRGDVATARIAVIASYWSAGARRSATAGGIGATLLHRLEGSELVHRLRLLAQGAAEPVGA